MATFRQGSWAYNFGIGVSPFDPYDSFDSLGSSYESDDLLKQSIKPWTYSDPQGLLDLRRTFAEFLEWKRGVPTGGDPSHVLVGAGAKPLIWATIQVLGRRIVLVEGSWVSYKSHAEMAGKPVIWVKADVTRGKMDWTSLEETLQEDDLLILSSPSNPWGTHYHDKDKERLGALIRKKKAWLMGDEIYWPLMGEKDQEETTSMGAYCPERSIVLDSLSKWPSGAGWRLGLAWFGMEGVLPKALSLTLQIYSCAPVPSQVNGLFYFSREAWDPSSPFQAKLAKERALLDQVRTYVWSRLASSPYFKDKPLVKPTSAFYIFFPLEAKDLEVLDSMGLRLVEGVHFGKKGYARLALTAFQGSKWIEVEEKDFEKGLTLWAKPLVEGLDLLVSYLDSIE